MDHRAPQTREISHRPDHGKQKGEKGEEKCRGMDEKTVSFEGERKEGGIKKTGRTAYKRLIWPALAKPNRGKVTLPARDL